MCDSLVLCLFSNVSAETIRDLINTAVGLDWTIEDMLLSGERGWNLKRAINNRLGLSRANDKLPKALLEPYPDGYAGGHVPDLHSMLDAYYTVRNWDPETGRPTREKLLALGLDEMANDLWG